MNLVYFVGFLLTFVFVFSLEEELYDDDVTDDLFEDVLNHKRSPDEENRYEDDIDDEEELYDDEVIDDLFMDVTRQKLGYDDGTEEEQEREKSYADPGRRRSSSRSRKPVQPVPKVRVARKTVPKRKCSNIGGGSSSKDCDSSGETSSSETNIPPTSPKASSFETTTPPKSEITTTPHGNIDTDISTTTPRTDPKTSSVQTKAPPKSEVTKYGKSHERRSNSRNCYGRHLKQLLFAVITFSLTIIYYVH